MHIQVVLINLGVSKSFLRRCVRCSVLTVVDGHPKVRDLSTRFDEAQILSHRDNLKKAYRAFSSNQRLNNGFDCSELTSYFN